jgi:hypothetical protein
LGQTCYVMITVRWHLFPAVGDGRQVDTASSMQKVESHDRPARGGTVSVRVLTQSVTLLVPYNVLLSTYGLMVAHNRPERGKTCDLVGRYGAER